MNNGCHEIRIELSSWSCIKLECFGVVYGNICSTKGLLQLQSIASVSVKSVLGELPWEAASIGRNLPKYSHNGLCDNMLRTKDGMLVVVRDTVSVGAHEGCDTCFAFKKRTPNSALSPPP